jgi:hypothetical protein
VNSTLKIQKSEPITLIEKIKAKIKKRAELKVKRMLLRVPRRLAKTLMSLVDQLVGIMVSSNSAAALLKSIALLAMA